MIRRGDSVWVTWQTGFWSFLGLGTEHKALYSGGKLYQNGQEYKRDNSYALKSVEDLNTINSEAGGKTIGSRLEGSDINYTLSDVRWYEGRGNKFMSDGNGGYLIKWDPSNHMGGLDEKGSLERDPFIGLAHEMAHGYNIDLFLKGEENWNTDTWFRPEKNGEPVRMTEKYACEWENKVRAEHNKPLRKFYGVKEIGGRNYEGLGPSLLKPNTR